MIDIGTYRLRIGCYVSGRHRTIERDCNSTNTNYRFPSSPTQGGAGGTGLYLLYLYYILALIILSSFTLLDNISTNSALRGSISLDHTSYNKFIFSGTCNIHIRLGFFCINIFCYPEICYCKAPLSAVNER